MIKKDGTIYDTVTGFDFTKDEPLGKSRSIRAKCLECASTSNEVKVCQMTDCTLWPYRLGKGVCVDPEGLVIQKRAGRTYTEEEKEAIRERFRKSREGDDIDEEDIDDEEDETEE